MTRRNGRTTDLTIRGLIQLEPALVSAGLLLIVSGAGHLLINMFSDAPPWDSPVGWRKPILFGFSTGVTCWSLAWVSALLEPSWRRRMTWPNRVLAVSLVAEVGLIDLQAWRGVASHFNRSTPLDAAIEDLMTALIAIAMAEMLALSLLIAVRPDEGVDRLTLRAARLGMTLLVVGGGLGFLAHHLGTEAVRAGRPPERHGTAGVPKFPHGIPLHAIQWLPLTLFALRRVRWPESRIDWVLRFEFGGHAGLTAYALNQMLAGHPRWPPSIESLLIGALTTMAFSLALPRLDSGRRR
jgi:hypothetical protein